MLFNNQPAELLSTNSYGEITVIVAEDGERFLRFAKLTDLQPETPDEMIAMEGMAQKLINDISKRIAEETERLWKMHVAREEITKKLANVKRAMEAATVTRKGS